MHLFACMWVHVCRGGGCRSPGLTSVVFNPSHLLRPGKVSKLNPELTMYTSLAWTSCSEDLLTPSSRPVIIGQIPNPPSIYMGSEDLKSSPRDWVASTLQMSPKPGLLPHSRPVEFLILPSVYFNSSCTSHCRSITSLVIWWHLFSISIIPYSTMSNSLSSIANEHLYEGKIRFT